MAETNVFFEPAGQIDNLICPKCQEPYVERVMTRKVFGENPDGTRDLVNESSLWARYCLKCKEVALRGCWECREFKGTVYHYGDTLLCGSCYQNKGNPGTSSQKVVDTQQKDKCISLKVVPRNADTTCSSA